MISPLHKIIGMTARGGMKEKCFVRPGFKTAVAQKLPSHRKSEFVLQVNLFPDALEIGLYICRDQHIFHFV